MFVLHCPFLPFLGLSRFFCDSPPPRFFPEFSRLVLFLLLGLLILFTAPTRNSPKRVCDTIWTFPEKSGKPPGLELPPVYLLPKSTNRERERDRDRERERDVHSLLDKSQPCKAPTRIQQVLELFKPTAVRETLDAALQLSHHAPSPSMRHCSCVLLHHSQIVSLRIL